MEVIVWLLGIAAAFSGAGIVALHFRINEIQEANDSRWRNASEWMRIQEEINESNDL